MRYLTHDTTIQDGDLPTIIPIDIFIDEARIQHPELSDDTLKLIYQLGVDDWSHFGYKDRGTDDSNLFQILAFLSHQMLEEKNNKPIVHFKDLFRWREITQLLGEDLLTCAYLAFVDKDSTSDNRDFDWPSVLHNDNPDLDYLFRSKGLCELHSHLKASTNTFEISWVCLMNHISGLNKEFEKLAEIHQPSVKKRIGETICEKVKEAANIRWCIYLMLKNVSKASTGLNFEELTADRIDSNSDLERSLMSDVWIPDYICFYPEEPMSVYAGERWFLYNAFREIYSNNNSDLTRLFYRYVLCKSLLRGYFIQVNNNIGFSNFKRYQDLKSSFLKGKYKHLLSSLPLWEASKHNFTSVFESRIAPVKSKKDLISKLKDISDFISEKNIFGEIERGKPAEVDWMLIFHFLKRKDKSRNRHFRNMEVRDANKNEGRILSQTGNLSDSLAMDAASSEFACRPEVYGQAFRFLRHFGFDTTYHAGEDFYDLADGLRAIDEAIKYLEFKSSDRIGHSLALGIDAIKYYTSRHKAIALPMQWMLDNVVWLLMKSKEYGISIDSNTEWFLTNTYKCLANEVGYIKDEDVESDVYNIYDIYDYWDSMALRGDNPDNYEDSGLVNEKIMLSPETWEYYSFVNDIKTQEIRNRNRTACQIYYMYHHDIDIRKKGEKVKAYNIPSGYIDLITAIQDAMIKEISNRQICIECCPSSNVRIGRLERFDAHPIFRFMPIDPNATRYPLAVTVNTDDLGVFSTSLPNEYSLLALALLKKKNPDGSHVYSTQEVYDWIARVIENGHKFTFVKSQTHVR